MTQELGKRNLAHHDLFQLYHARLRRSVFEFISSQTKSKMPDLFHLPYFASPILLPIIAVWTLVHLKLAVGEEMRSAERRYFVALIVMTVITLRTVVLCDECWFVHTATTAGMILGALLMPSRSEVIAS